MMGHHSRAESLFYYFRLEDQDMLLTLPECHVKLLNAGSVNSGLVTRVYPFRSRHPVSKPICIGTRVWRTIHQTAGCGKKSKRFVNPELPAPGAPLNLVRGATGPSSHATHGADGI